MWLKGQITGGFVIKVGLGKASIRDIVVYLETCVELLQLECLSDQNANKAVFWLFFRFANNGLAGNIQKTGKRPKMRTWSISSCGGDRGAQRQSIGCHCAFEDRIFHLRNESQ